jgi:hypothetical protein
VTVLTGVKELTQTGEMQAPSDPTIYCLLEKQGATVNLKKSIFSGSREGICLFGDQNGLDVPMSACSICNATSRMGKVVDWLGVARCL